MYKFLVLFLFSPQIIAQTSYIPSYVSLADTKVYDVEIILFAYNQALPNQSTYNNPKVFDYSNAIILEELSDPQKLIKEETPPSDAEDKYSINISDKTNKQALVWFEHNKTEFKLSSVWNKLQKNGNITPLLHRAWRQPETPFETPEYVQINTANINNDTLSENPLFLENALTGMVSLSKGRFLHFGHSINLYKQRQNGTDGSIENIIFTLTERKQLSSDELHYYDSPWIGSIVKITKITGETLNEE